MWNEFYIVTPDQSSFEAVFPPEWNYDGSGAEVDRVGQTEEGYWVNLRLKEGVPLPETLEPFMVTAPVSPLRVFA